MSEKADSPSGARSPSHRFTAWFFFAILALIHVGKLARADPEDYGFDLLEAVLWPLAATLVYLAHRRERRPPVPLAACGLFLWLVFVGAYLEGELPSGWPVPVASCAILAGLLAFRAGTVPVPEEPEVSADGDPDATASLVEQHAARLRARNRVAEAEKLERKARAIRDGPDA